MTRRHQGPRRKQRPSACTLGLASLAIIVGACGGSPANGPSADRRDGSTPRQSEDTSDSEPSTDTSAAAIPAPRDPLLFLSGSADVVALDTADGSVAMRAVGGVVAPDRSAIAQVVGNRVIALDPATGNPTWDHVIPPDRNVRVVAPGATQVALVDGRLSFPSAARAETEITIADADGTRELRIAGNVDPEAFTLDGRSLVAVEYLPALNPDHYSVRLIDVASGDVHPVPDQPGHFPNNKPRSEMRGTARTQTFSPDGRYLYTYYAAPEGVDDGPHKRYYAFVHVLDLELGEAYCIDLEAPFGTSADQWSEPALAISPDGSRLLVTDRRTGALAAIDPHTMEVVQNSTLDSAIPNASSPTATTGADILYLGLDLELLRIDPATLRVIDQIEMEEPITGLKLDTSGEVLYAVTTSGISVLDTHGTELERWPLPAETGGRADPAIAIPGSGAYQCAC